MGARKHVNKWFTDGQVRLITVGVNLVDHILELGLCRVLSERPHYGAQLLCGDGAIAVLVEEGEGLLELGNLLLGQLIRLEKRKQDTLGLASLSLFCLQCRSNQSGVISSEGK